MRLLDVHTIRHAGKPHYIELYHGDLAAIPREIAVDLLVVSAFEGDYTPTSSSLIGALHRRGINVGEMAAEKEFDLRETTSCWISQAISGEHPHVGFRRLLCFEPGIDRVPAEVVGDVFRAIVPLTLTELPVRTLATSVLATGDRANDAEEMLGALFRAAGQWIRHGLGVEAIRIVVYRQSDVEPMRLSFGRLAEEDAASAPRGNGRATSSAPPPYDFFISYSRNDSDDVAVLQDTLRKLHPGVRLFVDQNEIDPGDSWQSRIDEAIGACRKVIAVLTPSFFTSKPCMEELNMARVRHRNTGDVIVPLHVRSAELSLYTQTLHVLDCCEGDRVLMKDACRKMIDVLPPI